MKIRNKQNGGYASVSDELAQKLVATGAWEIPKTAPAKKAPSKATKPEED